MRALSIIPLAIITVVYGSVTYAQPFERSNTLILFGASWCAPCIAEVRGISAIAAAASGERVVIAWVDGKFADLRLPLPPNVQVASPHRARELEAAFAADKAGYPYSVMLDGQGRRCSRWRRLLNVEGVRAMQRECAKSGM